LSRIKYITRVAVRDGGRWTYHRATKRGPLLVVRFRDRFVAWTMPKAHETISVEHSSRGEVVETWLCVMGRAYAVPINPDSPKADLASLNLDQETFKELVNGSLQRRYLTLKRDKKDVFIGLVYGLLYGLIFGVMMSGDPSALGNPLVLIFIMVIGSSPTLMMIMFRKQEA